MDKFEVSVTVEGNTFEYFTFCKPNVGEYLDITCDGFDGEFLVTKVSHRIFEDTRKGTGIKSYLNVEAIWIKNREEMNFG